MIDFYADRCGPCRMLAPIMDQIAEEYDISKVKVIKVNTDLNPELTEKFEIVSIPQVFIFQGGKQLEKLSGVNPKTVYTERLDHLLNTTA